MDIVLLYTTLPDENSANSLVQVLLDLKLIACANQINGMKSTYRWQGKIEKSVEVIVILKTRAELSEICQKAILKHHPYTLPCILELPVKGGHSAYLEWLYEETLAPDSKEP